MRFFASLTFAIIARMFCGNHLNYVVGLGLFFSLLIPVQPHVLRVQILTSNYNGT